MNDVTNTITDSGVAVVMKGGIWIGQGAADNQRNFAYLMHAYANEKIQTLLSTTYVDELMNCSHLNSTMSR